MNFFRSKVLFNVMPCFDVINVVDLSTVIRLLLRGQILKRTYGTVTCKTRKIGAYSENVVPNAWLKQSE